jgi:hypothetical protein
VYDFIDKHLGKAIPYGVYDVTHNEGSVSVGVDHDTANLRSQVSSDGGTTWGAWCIPTPKGYSSLEFISIKPSVAMV